MNPASSSDDRALDVLAAAKLMGIGRTNFLTLAGKKGFPAGCRLGRRRVWLRSSLIAWAKRNGG